MTNLALDELYRDAPPARYEQLHAFRAAHPYRRLSVGGVEWEYIASGEGEHALLLLGGGLSVGETSFRTILRLEGRFRVISPSYPPVGRMKPVAEGLAAILMREGFQRAHVFGHSLGAAVGHVFVRLRPECVDRLALDGFGLYTPGHTRLARWFLKLPYPWLLAYYRRVFRRLLAEGEDEERRFMAAYIEELLTVIHTRATLLGQFALLMEVFDRAAEYGVFQTVERPGRVLLMLADDDRGFTPAERDALVASYPGARVHRFAQGGHLSGFAHPAEFNATLDEFLMA